VNPELAQIWNFVLGLVCGLALSPLLMDLANWLKKERK